MSRVNIRAIRDAAEEMERHRAQIEQLTDCLVQPGGSESSRAGLIQELSQISKKLRQHSECLQEAAGFYQSCEERAADVFRLEYIRVPETVFGTSRFSELRKQERLLPIRNYGHLS